MFNFIKWLGFKKPTASTTSHLTALDFQPNHRLYEQGASKRRIGLYLVRWLGWASISIAAPAVAIDCIPFTG